MSILIVSLPLPSGTGEPAAEYGYVLTGDGHAALRHGSAPPALLPVPGRPGGEIVALVPARALSWQQVELPRGVRSQSPQRQRAVLDGLLEERLLDEPQNLHFALAPGLRSGTPGWIAVCDRAWLRGALQALEAAGRPATRIVPEFAPDDSPAPQRILHALGQPDDAWWVATGERAGSAVAMLPLSAAGWALLGGGDAGASDDVAPAALYAEPAVASLAEAAAGQTAMLETATDRWLAAARGPWDLAQFDLASSNRSRAVKRAGSWVNALLRAPQWRAARWGLALLVLANLGGLNAWAWKSQAALDAQEASIRGVLTQTFPSVKVVVDAPVQMEREIALLRQATGSISGGDLESLLTALGAAVPPGHSARAIDFSAGEARVRGLQLAAEDTTRVTDLLRAQGLAVRSEGEVLTVRLETPR